MEASRWLELAHVSVQSTASVKTIPLKLNIFVTDPNRPRLIPRLALQPRFQVRSTQLRQ